MCPSPVFRALHKEDWEELAAIRLEALKTHPGAYASNYEKELNKTETEWQNMLSQKDGCVFGAFSEGWLTGIGAVFPHSSDPSGATGSMSGNYVKPACRKQGIAGDIGRLCVKWALSFMPWKKLIVAHRGDNDASKRMIKGLGFDFFEIVRDKVWPDGKVDDEYWYQIDLDRLRQGT